MPKLNAEESEALAVLSKTREGRVFLGVMGKRFDEAMQRLLYSDVDVLPAAQGAARELHETLKLFDDAVKAQGVVPQ